MFYSSYNQNICNSYKNFLITVFYMTTYITSFASYFIILSAYSHSTSQLIYISVLIALTFIKPLSLYLYSFNNMYHSSCLRRFENTQNPHYKYLLFTTFCNIYFLSVIFSISFFSETITYEERLFFKVIVVLNVFADYLIFLNIFSNQRLNTFRVTET